jgi:hypothetical protein
MYALVSSGAVESVQIGRLRRVPARRPGHAWLLKLSAWEDVGRRSGRTERERNSRGTDRGPSFAVAPPGLGPPDPWEAYCRPHCAHAQPGGVGRTRSRPYSPVAVPDELALACRQWLTRPWQSRTS